VTLKNAVLWDVTRYSLVDIYQNALRYIPEGSGVFVVSYYTYSTTVKQQQPMEYAEENYGTFNLCTNPDIDSRTF
jgi:hypothetical protein